jgi:hypothetical protein
LLRHGSWITTRPSQWLAGRLSAAILGDWREEVIWHTSDSRALWIYSTTEPRTSGALR